MAKVYIKVNSKGWIESVCSSTFLSDTSGWIEYDEGDGDRYIHAQSNYLPQPIATEDGVYQYKLVDGIIVERTAEEIISDIESMTAMPTDKERIEALEVAMLEIAEVVAGG